MEKLANKSIENLKQKAIEIVNGTYTCDTDFANLCTLMASLDFFIESEEYEVCAKIVAYLNNTPEMQIVKENFADYFEIWLLKNKIF